MKTDYCPSCQREVEVAEGRCWECCRILGYPVEALSERGVVDLDVTSSAPDMGEGLLAASCGDAASRAPRSLNPSTGRTAA